MLLVDSAPMMRGVLGGVLRQLGYRVMEASGALGAQKLAATRGEIDLLLLDLPGSDRGDLQLALWFHGMYPKTKILIATASLWDLNCHVGQSPQFACLAKPFTPHELARVIRRVLEQESGNRSRASTLAR